MAHILFEIDLPFAVEEVFKYRTAEGAREKLTPTWQKVKVLAYEGEPPRDGTCTFTLQEKWLPPIKWKTAFSDYKENEGYTETLLAGPFKKWVHKRTFKSTGKNSCHMVDEIEFVLPMGKIGEWMGGKETKTNLEALFDFRYKKIMEDLPK